MKASKEESLKKIRKISQGIIAKEFLLENLK